MKKYEPYEEELIHNSVNNAKESKEEPDKNFDVTNWVDDVIKEEPFEDEIVISHQEDELLDSINESLAKQVCKELEEETEIEDNGKSKLPRPAKIAMAALGSVLLILTILFLTPAGRNFLWQSATEYAYGKMNYDDGLEVIPQEVVDDVEDGIQDIPLGNEDLVLWDAEHTEDGPRQEAGITNILILGEEAIDSGTARGRTDIMMIGTMNANDGSIKLTSLMRDLLVQIPEYKDNKLNVSYQIGGIPLLYETIELNFDIKLDGYVMVGFDDFEALIDKLDGVEISLTSSEARYLNSTNYISKSQYRNVVAGLQNMNGNQALGYCRIRYVATKDQELNDFGRTSRQRILLNAIFDKYKSKSLPELALLFNGVLPMITTDIPKTDFDLYLKTAVTMGLTDIQNFRLPADNTFDEGYVRGMSVLIPDIPANIEALHEFIFGSTK